MKTLVVALAAILVLVSCSYVYDLRAVMIEGRLAFDVDGSPDCFESISITGFDDGSPGPADSGDAWVWRERFADCANLFPVFYGQTLKGGSPAVEYVHTRVAAKQLKVGVIYDVTTSSRGGGYGSGRFRLMADGGVENLPRTPRLDRGQGPP